MAKLSSLLPHMKKTDGGGGGGAEGEGEAGSDTAKISVLANLVGGFLKGFKEGLSGSESSAITSSSSSGSSSNDNNNNNGRRRELGRLASGNGNENAWQNLISNFSLDSLDVQHESLGRENGGNDNGNGGEDDRSYCALRVTSHDSHLFL